MGIAGSITPTGGAPKPDPARVAAIRYTIVDEPETCATFGENARAALADLNHRGLAETRNGDLGECSRLLDHVRDRVAGLDPARLHPRGGLAGLFDSRTKSLKEFRASYASAASVVSQSAADIGDRAGALARKSTALETLWSETRDAIAELDAHIAAARGWLANEAPATVVEPDTPIIEDATPQVVEDAKEPVESVSALDQAEEVSDQAESEAALAPLEVAAEEPPVVSDEVPSEPDAHPEATRSTTAVPETGETPATIVLVEPAEPVEIPEVVAEAPVPDLAPEPQPEPELTPVAALPHPLQTRLAALEAVRATAIGRLPLLRAAQNAELRAPAALKQICDGVEAWRADWQDALGLAGKKPKKVSPDRHRLTTATSALTDRIDAAGRELSDVQGRRAELDARIAPAPETALAA